MKKKFLCLFLVVFMLVTALASCSSDADKVGQELEQNQARLTKTLVMYLMSEQEVPQKNETDIEEALNNLTKSKFKTQIDIRFFTPDKYYTELEKAIKAQENDYNKSKKEEQEIKDYNQYLKESCLAAGIPVVTVKPKATATAANQDETIYNADYGIIEYKYPEPGANQVNIFYLGGYEKYQTYVDNDWLEPLDSELEYTSKKLKEHIPAVYLDNIKAAGVYGIPNNSLIGNYKWMLLDKALMEKYFYTADSISASYTDPDLYNFLSDVATFERDGDDQLTVLPIKGELDPINMFYWSYDSAIEAVVNNVSLLGVSCPNAAAVGTNLSVKSIFHDANYVSQLETIKTFESEGLFGDENDQEKPFAMSVIEGSFDVYDIYGDDYYVKLLESPKADNTNLYNNMFCVNHFASLADTENTKRCMEIITYINTNPEARNLLQYGIEGQDYTIDSDGVLHRTENATYIMDINKTGNIFMAHPEEGKPADFWDRGVEHCENLSINPAFGFNVDANSNMDLDAFEAVLELTEEYMQRIEECETPDDVKELVSQAKSELAKDPNYSRVTTLLAPDGTDPYSLHFLYDKWLDDNNYKVK